MKRARAMIMGVALLASTAPALAEILVIVNTVNPATKMFSEQAAQFFLGKSNQFTPIDHARESSIRSEFYQKVANKSLPQVEAIWSKIVFSAKGSPPKQFNSDAEVKKAVAADPSAIGYIDASSVDSSVKVVLTVH